MKQKSLQRSIAGKMLSYPKAKCCWACFKAYFPVRNIFAICKIYIDSRPYVDVIGVHSEEMKEVTEKRYVGVYRKICEDLTVL